MLQELRDKAKSFVSYTMLILLVISFGIWGVGDVFRNGGHKDWVAKVGDAKITPQMLQREFNNQVARLQAMVGPEFTAKKAMALGLGDQALQQLITTLTVDQEAARMGLSVSNQRIVQLLEETPQLRNKDGSFNKALFRTILAREGVDEAGFFATQRQIAARNMLLRSIGNQMTVPEYALTEIAKAAAQKRVAELVQIQTAALAVAPPPDATVLQKFYEANKENYQTAETRSFEVLTLTPADIKGIALTDDEVKAAYAAQKSAFVVPEKRTIIQAVFADEAKANAFAAKGTLMNPPPAAKATVKGKTKPTPAAPETPKTSEETFEQAAKAAGVESVKLEGVSRADLPAPLATAIFASPISETFSKPVKTDLGWHVFVVRAIIAGKTMGFAEAEKAVREKVQQEKAAQTIGETANKIDDMLAANKPLSEIATSLALPLQKVGPVDASGNGANIPFKNQTLQTAFHTNQNETSPVVEAAAGGYLVVHTSQVTPPHILPFAAVKDKVAVAWAQSQRVQQAASIAKTIAEKLKAGAPLTSISGAAIRTTTSPPVTEDAVKQHDVPREALTPLFTMNKGEVAVVGTAQGDVVLRVKAIIQADAKEVEARKAALKESLAQEYTGMTMDNFTAALSKTIPVEVDEAARKGLFSTAPDENN